MQSMDKEEFEWWMDGLMTELESLGYVSYLDTSVGEEFDVSTIDRALHDMAEGGYSPEEAVVELENVESFNESWVS